MDIGLYLVLTDASMPITTLAQAIEERGFDSIWVPEHSHIPTTGSTPYPGRGPVTRDFARTLDPFVALAAAAGVTKRIKLATGICLLIQRDTINTAKTVATLDHLSGGRVLFGVGGGWNKPEMENHGTVYATRFKRLEEQLQALKTIWTQDEAEFHGEHVDFGPMWCWPKPVAKPHPPIFIGGETDHTLQRIVKFGDGWLPRVRDPELVLKGIGKLRTYARAAGRADDDIAISAFGVAGKQEAIQPFRDAGVGRAIIPLPPGTPDDIMRRLDRYAALI
jgi:probable F420-dependent oxidoreductase